MLISVIIPVYNVEPYLRQCLDSVLQQQHVNNYEIICINDGSTDNSRFILDEYAKKYDKIKVISQENRGLSAARNTGIRAASGEYIFFLDSDDWIEPNALKVLLDSISGVEDMICFNGRRFFEDGTNENPDNGITENSLTGWEYYNKYALLQRQFHFVCVVLRIYRREFILENDLFFMEGIYHEDNLFTPMVCYNAQKVKVIPDIIYIYRIRSGSITQSRNKKHLYDTITVANQLSAFFIPLSGLDKCILYREIAGEYFKGFMPEKRKIYGKNDIELIKRIDWNSFKIVSVYPRHKRIYKLLKLHPVFFRQYIKFELFIKKFSF